MKNIIKSLALILALLCISSAFFSCNENGVEENTESEKEYSTMPEYDAENIGSYIKPFKYEGLTVEATAGVSAQASLWNYIVESVEILKYPEAQVEYYVSQERAKYRYFAKRDGIEYEELIEALGITEESMKAAARALVKDDLALMYIINDAKIKLEDAEVAAHTDKYAEKLSEIYGYDAEYIKQNMSEQIYEAMLYDKTMEYLLSRNTVETK